MELEKLGTLERDAEGMVTWNHFAKLLHIGSRLGKKKFAVEKKAEALKKRREVLASGDESKYAEMVKEMILEEEAAIQNFLGETFERAGISDDDASK